jgi:hypothetical protein
LRKERRKDKSWPPSLRVSIPFRIESSRTSWWNRSESFCQDDIQKGHGTWFTTGLWPVTVRISILALYRLFCCYDIPQHEVIHILVPEAPGLADRQPFGNISPTIRYLYPREHLQGRSLVKGTQSLVLMSLPLSIQGCISFLFWIMRMYIKLSNEEDILRSSRNSLWPFWTIGFGSSLLPDWQASILTYRVYSYICLIAVNTVVLLDIFLVAISILDIEYRPFR